jgi:hypothetical protein
MLWSTVLPAKTLRVLPAASAARTLAGAASLRRRNWLIEKERDMADAPPASGEVTLHNFAGGFPEELGPMVPRR